jgi:hypothetical protein
MPTLIVIIDEYAELADEAPDAMAALALAITDPDGKGRALPRMAGALAEAGQHEQAETVARSITDPDEQADALAEVAKALVARGDTTQAYHVASAACSVVRWTKVLGLVLSLEPTAIRVLTDS